jgi:hypothetical protein
MADANSVRDKCRLAYDEACEAAGTPNVQGQIDAAVAAAAAPLQQQVATLTAKIDAARAAAQADQAQDAAHVSGQAVLDALA